MSNRYDGHESFCVKAMDVISPATNVVRNYTKKNAMSDVLAGVTVGILILPQSMAYAQLANLPPIYGLYTSVVPAIIYALIGTSHTVNCGTLALSGLLTGELIEQVVGDASENEADAINVALATAFLTGMVLLIVGLLRLGDTLESYMSPALTSGFHSGATFHVCVSQFQYVFGTPKWKNMHGPGHIVRKIYFTCSKFAEANVAAILISVTSATLLICCQKITSGNIRFRFPFRKKLQGEGRMIEFHSSRTATQLALPIPGELLIVILFEILSWSCDFENNYNVTVLGSIDAHMPPVRNLDWYIVGELVQTYYMDILVIAMITFSLTLSDAKMHSEEADRIMKPNREIFALSLTNIISPFFGAYIAGAGISRSAIAVQIDTRGNLTQLYSIISALFVLLLIPLVQYVKMLPQAVLGTVVLTALRGVFVKHWKRAHSFWKYGRETDFVVWVVTTAVTLFADLDWGVMIGLLMTVNMVFRLLANAKLTDLGRMPGSEEYVDLEKGGIEFPGVKIVKMESPLFFGSKDRFYEAITKSFSEQSHNADDDDNDDDDDGHNGRGSGSKVTESSALIPKSPSSDMQKQQQLQQQQQQRQQRQRQRQSFRQGIGGSPNYHTLVIDASALIFIDVAGVEKLLTISRFLRARGATLVVANVSDSVSKVLKQSELQSMSEIPLIFDTVGAAVLAGADRGIFGKRNGIPSKTPRFGNTIKDSPTSRGSFNSNPLFRTVSSVDVNQYSNDASLLLRPSSGSQKPKKTKSTAAFNSSKPDMMLQDLQDQSQHSNAESPEPHQATNSFDQESTPTNSFDQESTL